MSKAQEDGDTFVQMDGELIKKEEVVMLESENCSNVAGLRAYNHFEYLTKKMLGEMLTIVDATIVSERQNKALKDVIKNSTYRMLSGAQSYCSEMDSQEGASWGSSINLEELN